MTLRGKSPELIQKRLKAFFYGAAGVGKTTASIQFPCPYLIDTERGSENKQYIDILKKSQGCIFQTSDLKEIKEEVFCLLREKHPYKTLIIDPLTIVYSNLLENISKKDPASDAFGRVYVKANNEIKSLMMMLLRLDMNVIITSHAKNEYGPDMRVMGQTFDCYKKLDYLFDLVIEISIKNKERIGTVKKTRIESFPEQEEFIFNYKSISEKYGVEIMEKSCDPVEMATENQISEIIHLIEVLKIPQDWVSKCLLKANANEFREMKSDMIQACIESLRSKI